MLGDGACRPMIQLITLPVAVLAAIVPMALFLLTAWWLDRYEREPLWMVLATFFWGAVGAVLLAIVGSLLLEIPLAMILAADAQEAAGAVLVAPFVEEITKGCILLLLLRHRLFDNATDGFVYGAAAGLGFGMTENFLYFSMVGMSGDAGGFFLTIFLRTAFSAPLHAMASGTFGAALGLAKFQRAWPLRWSLPPLGLLMGMGLHFFWNAMAVYLGSQAGGLFGGSLAVFVQFGGLILYFVAFFGLFQLSMLHERWIIGHELDEEARRGILPRSYVPILQSYLRRMRRDWLPAAIPHHHFVALCTRLAFRKHQARRCRPAQRFDYDEEVRVLRQELQALIERAGS
jgi:protease PrsW